MPNSQANQQRRTLLLTGASRGIGHATVKRFSAAGWRVITCSRHPFPENCPWEAGPEDHIQVDLANEANTLEAIAETKRRLDGRELHALVNNAAISPKAEGGKRLGTLATSNEDWHHVFQVNFFAPIMLARGLIVEQIPMHRLGTPDEVAKIIYVLCTDTGSYVNGAEIHINGGEHV